MAKQHNTTSPPALGRYDYIPAGCHLRPIEGDDESRGVHAGDYALVNFLGRIVGIYDPMMGAQHG